MKGLENISVAKQNIQDLEAQKVEKTNEHRNTIIDFNILDVN